MKALFKLILVLTLTGASVSAKDFSNPNAFNNTKELYDGIINGESGTAFGSAVLIAPVCAVESTIWLIVFPFKAFS